MKDYLKLIRVIHLLLIAVIQAFVFFAAVIPITAQFGFALRLPYWIVASLIAATTLIAAGGFVINDYFDIKIDRLNRPDSVIVSNSISKKDAMRIYQILTVAGVAIGVVASVVLKSFTLAFIYIIVAGLLWFYSSSYKRMLIVGNIVVALMAGLVPLVPAFAAKEQLVLDYTKMILELPIIPQLYTFCGTMSLFAFLAVMSLEILKDMRDEYGDREMECHTIPVVLGITTSRIISTVLTLMACGLAVFASYRIAPADTLSLRYSLFAIVLPSLFLLYFVWSKNCKVTENAIHVNRLIILLAGLYPLVYYYLLSK